MTLNLVDPLSFIALSLLFALALTGLFLYVKQILVDALLEVERRKREDDLLHHHK